MNPEMRHILIILKTSCCPGSGEWNLRWRAPQEGIPEGEAKAWPPPTERMASPKWCFYILFFLLSWGWGQYKQWERCVWDAQIAISVFGHKQQSSIRHASPSEGQRGDPLCVHGVCKWQWGSRVRPRWNDLRAYPSPRAPLRCHHQFQDDGIVSYTLRQCCFGKVAFMS